MSSKKNYWELWLTQDSLTCNSLWNFMNVHQTICQLYNIHSPYTFLSYFDFQFLSKKYILYIFDWDDVLQ